MQIRHLMPSDRPLIERHFLALQSHSRCARFHNAISDAAIERFAANLRFCSDISLGAIEEGELIGYVLVAPHGETGELAISIADKHQRAGLGTRLIRRAIDAAGALGVQYLELITTSDNTAMMRTAAHCGFVRAVPAPHESGCIKYRLPLVATPGDWAFEVLALTMAACSAQSRVLVGVSHVA